MLGPDELEDRLAQIGVRDHHGRGDALPVLEHDAGRSPALDADAPHGAAQQHLAAVALDRACERAREPRIIHEFGGLEEVLAASDEDLEDVEGVGTTRAKDIREGVRRLQEVDPIDRYLQF